MERGSSRNDIDLGDHLRRSPWTWTIQSQAITIMGSSAGIEAVAWWVIFVCPFPFPCSADFSGPLYSTALWSVLEPRRGAGRGNQWRETLSREKGIFPEGAKETELEAPVLSAFAAKTQKVSQVWAIGSAASVWWHPSRWGHPGWAPRSWTILLLLFFSLK